MKLFCREDHTPRERDIKHELLEARAHLARLKLLPPSDFTRMNPDVPFVIAEHGLDRKPKVIARAEATVAELEVLVADGENI